jgi:TRAP-type C4-dicarboxylate transport system substrate-binding protein
MKFRTIRSAGPAAVGAVAAVMISTTSPVQADNFVLRVASGWPTAALQVVSQTEKFFVPEVTKRVAARTGHTVRFIEGYGGTIANLFETLESTEKGLTDIGIVCSCFEPTKMFPHNYPYYAPYVSGDPHVAGPVGRQLRQEFPFLNSVMENDYNQIVLGNPATDDYGLGTSFPWTRAEDLKGKKIGAAGPNVPWLDFAGATPVQTNLNEVYNALQSGIYSGVVIFPTPYNSLKFYETGKYYTEMGWNSVTVVPLTVNKKSWERLPAEIRDIIREVALEWELVTEKAYGDGYATALANLRANGATVTKIDPEQRTILARQIEPWVNTRAGEIEDMGHPGKALVKRFVEISIEKGAAPAHVYNIK